MRLDIGSGAVGNPSFYRRRYPEPARDIACGGYPLNKSTYAAREILRDRTVGVRTTIAPFGRVVVVHFYPGLSSGLSYAAPAELVLAIVHSTRLPFNEFSHRL